MTTKAEIVLLVETCEKNLGEISGGNIPHRVAAIRQGLRHVIYLLGKLEKKQNAVLNLAFSLGYFLGAIRRKIHKIL